VTVRRLNRYKVIEIRRLSGIENFVSERNFKPLKRFQNRSDVLEFRSRYNSSSKSILGVLETIYLIFRKSIMQRVAIIKLGMYYSGVKVKVKTDRAECTNLMIAGFR